MNSLDLRRFFAPRSVALVGATSDLSKFGGRCFRQLRDFGYSGTIYPINPRLQTLDGLRCYPSIRDLPEVPDHVCIVVPSAVIPETLRQCGERGIAFATVFSSGFAEGGSPEGLQRQQEIVQIARQHGLRFMGPNCNGLINYIDGVALTSTATINGPCAPKGDVAVLGHSGGLAQVNVMWRAQQAGLGISYQVSSGNDADLDLLDYASYMVDDSETRVILLLAETIRNAEKLRDLAQRAQLAAKPIVMMKLGRTIDGQRAAVSHTGALAGSDAVVDDVLRQLGIIRVNDCHEMIEAAMMLRTGRPFVGHRLAAVSISGGNLVHLADQGPLQGLSFPAFGDETQDRLAGLIPNYGRASNPADVTSAAIGAPDIFSSVMDAIAADESVDVVVPVLTLHSSQIIEATANAALRSSKPFAMIWSGGCTDDPELTPAKLVQRGIPVFRDIAPAMQAIRQAANHATFVATARNTCAPAATDLSKNALTEMLHSFGPRPTEVDAKRLLAAAGLAVPPSKFASTPEEVGLAAMELSGSVAVKLVSRDVGHKTEVGGVHLNVRSRTAAVEAAHAILGDVHASARGITVEGFLVETMVAPGIEMILGLSRDQVLGMIITAGFGGVHAELLEDVAHRMLPIDEEEAHSMLRQLRGWRLLDGFRGADPADVDALLRMMVRLSQFGQTLGDDFEALDLNPVIVGKRGQGAVACDALLIQV